MMVYCHIPSINIFLGNENFRKFKITTNSKIYSLLIKMSYPEYESEANHGLIEIQRVQRTLD